MEKIILIIILIILFIIILILDNYINYKAFYDLNLFNSYIILRPKIIYDLTSKLNHNDINSGNLSITKYKNDIYIAIVRLSNYKFNLFDKDIKNVININILYFFDKNFKLIKNKILNITNKDYNIEDLRIFYNKNDDKLLFIGTNNKNIIQEIVFGSFNNDFLILHNSYNDNNIIEILHKNNIHGILHLSLFEESYCYALTNSINSGIPIFYLNRGSFNERLSNNNKYFSTSIKNIFNNFDNFLKYIIDNQNAYNFYNLNQNLQPNKWYLSNYK